ncbi:MAG: nuclear transport factor 2 family protein [Alphaproteobacteria bacterium]|nr:nuclear transport factor 2 family protein [Alphaproteobacteria bacterium]
MEAKETVVAFYEAFARKDGAAMAASYAPDATFSDPVFPGLDGRRAGAMWRMLTERSADLRVEHEVLSAEGDTVKVRWNAWYTFTATNRPVHNVIDATIVVRDGLIRRHEDVFDFWRWSRQALGVSGWLLGWTPIVRNKVRAQAGQQLDRFVEKHGA